MVARNHAESEREAGRVVGRDVRACLAQGAEKAGKVCGQAAQPVVSQDDGYALRQFFQQDVADAAAEGVVGEDVHFDADALFGRQHGRFPGGEVFRTVEQDFDAVARTGLRTGGAGDQLFDQAVGGNGGFAAHAVPLCCRIYLRPSEKVPGGFSDGLCGSVTFVSNRSRLRGFLRCRAKRAGRVRRVRTVLPAWRRIVLRPGIFPGRRTGCRIH